MMTENATPSKPMINRARHPSHPPHTLSAGKPEEDIPSVHVDLEKELTCSICTDILYRPLTLLDCLHTFCGGCLKEWFSWQNIAATQRARDHHHDSFSAKSYTCPSCRAAVRETRSNATVTTLLDMWLKANPARERSEEDKKEVDKGYKKGERVLPELPVARRTDGRSAARTGYGGHDEHEADRILMQEVRQLSLREMSVRPPEGTSIDRLGGERLHRRRERSAMPPDLITREGERDPRTEVIRRDRSTQRTARSLGLQSSLRSLFSGSDSDSHEIEERIIRQILDDGLLDGIDIASMDASQEDELSELIAQAYRQRKREQQEQRDREHGPERERRRASTETRNASQIRRARDERGQNRHNRPSRPPVSRPQLLQVATGSEHAQRRSSSHGSTRRLALPASAEDRPSTSDGARQASRSPTGLSLGVESGDRSLATVRAETGRRSSSDTHHRSELGSSAPRNASISLPDPTAPENTMLQPQEHFSRRSDPRSSRSRNTSISQPDLATPTDTTLQANAHRTRLASRERTSTNPEAMSSRRLTNSEARSASDTWRSVGVAPSGRSSPSMRATVDTDAQGRTFATGLSSPRSSLDSQARHREHAHTRHLQTNRTALPNPVPTRISTSSSNSSLNASALSIAIPPSLEVVNSDLRLCHWHKPITGIHCASCHKQHIEHDLHYACRSCNDGVWFYCITCVQEARHCTHPLLPLTRTLDGTVKSLTVHVTCANCLYPVAAFSPHFHCPTCQTGTNDFCTSCYDSFLASGNVSHHNGPYGWRRCPQGHRMLVVVFDLEKRAVLEGVVGGWALHDGDDSAAAKEPVMAPDTPATTESLIAECDGKATPAGLQRWSWRDPEAGGGWKHKKRPSPRSARGAENLNSRDAAMSVDGNGPADPSTITATPVRKASGTGKGCAIPPSGGCGMRLQAQWARTPDEGIEDELAFPRGAEITEVVDINGDWFWGVYCRKGGLFPGGWGRVL